MKFPTFNTADIKTFHIESLKNGLSFGEAALSDDGICLADCKNVWFDKEVLKSRAGLFTAKENILNDEAYRGGYSYYYRTLDVEITVEEDIKRVVIEDIEYDNSIYICLTHFINSDGTLWNTAKISFYRSSADAFYIPKSTVFFKGAPKNGAGLYAFVSLVNIEDFSQTESRIYEINTDFSAWEITGNTYIPTVLINGRGNNYEIAAATNQAFTGNPTRLEKLNLLNGQFHAYYSTDGRSSSFRLPFSNIADDTVSGRLYYSLTKYVDWTIPSGATSAKSTIYDVTVSMNVDRAKGIVYFTVEAGDYEVPLLSHQNENNLRFTATKSGDYGFSDVAASTLALSANSKILLANKNILFEADYSNPLYFPSDSVTSVGEADSSLTAFGVLKNNIIAFKQNETYLLSVSNGKALNSVSLLADNDSVFYEGDTLNAECISPAIGCADKNSLIPFDRQLFWRGADGYIYVLNSASKQIFCVSDKINAFIDGNISPTAKTCGARHGNYNIFIADGKAVAMECNSESLKSGDRVSWYYWEFPENLQFLGAFTTKGKPWLLCCNTDCDLCFTATLKGDTDIFLTGSIYEPETAEIPFKSAIRTGKIALGCSNTFKKIDAVLLNIKTQRADIRINDRLEAEICRHQDGDIYKPVKLLSGLCGVDAIDITVESESGFSLGSVDIKYTQLKL